MVDLSIGDKCNSSCIMCTTVRPEDKDVKNLLIPLEQLQTTIKSISDPEYIAITGGEPTIHPDIMEVIAQIRDRFPNVELKLLTNARMLSYPDYCRSIVASGVDTLIIPLHAHHPDLHDFITRSKGSFDQTIKGIENSLQHDVKVEIRIVIHGINYPFLPETAKLIAEEYPKASVVMLYFDVIGSGFLNMDRLVVPMSKVVPYLQQALEHLRSQNVKAYHMPKCLLPEKYHPFVHGQTVVDRRIIYTEDCEGCSARSDCCGIWKTYEKLQGTGEFKPI